MIKLLPAALITLFIFSSAGCDSGVTQSNTALVVDLPAIARALGRDSEMTQTLEQARQQLSEQLVKIGTDLERQLKEKETALDKVPAKEKEESRKQLEQLTQQAKLQLRKTQQLANQKATSFRDKLLSDFRKEVMTVSESIAKKRKAVAVYTAGNNMLWYSSSIDITDEVIGVMRAQANDAENKLPADSVTEKKAQLPATIVPDVAE